MWEGGGTVLNGVIRERLTGKVTFGQRPGREAGAGLW